MRRSLPFCRLTDLQTRGCVKAAVLFSVALQSVSSASTGRLINVSSLLLGFSRISFFKPARMKLESLLKANFFVQATNPSWSGSFFFRLLHACSIYM